jgi:hypothetical protein
MDEDDVEMGYDEVWDGGEVTSHLLSWLKLLYAHTSSYC